MALDLARSATTRFSPETQPSPVVIRFVYDIIQDVKYNNKLIHDPIDNKIINWITGLKSGPYLFMGMYQILLSDLKSGNKSIKMYKWN